MTAPDHVRILVADSHPIVRLGVADSIHTEPDLKVTGEAASGDEVISLLRKHQYDVILLDIAMPGKKNGLDTLHAIRQIEPAPAVLIFSEYPESLYAISMLRAGAKGFISKSDPPAALTGAIRRVASGNHYLSDATLNQLVSQVTLSSDRPMHETLSAREFQIFYRIAIGQDPMQIAKELNLSAKTVSSYRSGILQKKWALALMPT